MKVYKYHSWITAAAALIILSSGCMKSDLDELESKEEDIIQQYLTDNNISGDAKTPSGIYYIEDVAGTGRSPEAEDYIFINYTGRFLENNQIRETSDSSLKDDWTTAEYLDNYLYGPAKVIYGHTIPGINDGLAMMKEGGKARIIIPSDKAYYDFNPLIYELELLKVVKDPLVYEDSVLHAYLDYKGFGDNAVLDTLVWYMETETPDPDDMRFVQATDTVYIRFEGRLVDGFRNPPEDGRIFDSNMDDEKPLKYIFGQSKVVSGHILSVPAGFKKAIQDTMRQGTHATAVLHYSQAFGDNGLVNSLYYYTVMPKYQTVVYDIIVEAIKPATLK